MVRVSSHVSKTWLGLGLGSGLELGLGLAHARARPLACSQPHLPRSPGVRRSAQVRVGVGVEIQVSGVNFWGCGVALFKLMRVSDCVNAARRPVLQERLRQL